MVKSLFLRSGFYFLGLVFVKFFSTFLFIGVANVLSLQDVGTISFFLTVLSLFTLVGDWGLIQWYQVQFAQKNDVKLESVVGQARLVLLCIAMVVFFFYYLLTKPFTPFLSFLFVIMLIPEGLLSVSDGYYLVRKQTYKIVVKQFFKYTLPFLFILYYSSKTTVEELILCFLASSLLSLFWYVPRSYFSLVGFSWQRIKNSLKSSSSYASLLLTSAVYSRGDSFILDATLGRTAVAQYSLGYRYLDALSLFPSALSQNLFHLSAQKTNLNARKLIYITILMAGVGLVAGGALFGMSQFLSVKLLGSGYAETQSVISIFAAVIILMFINSPLSTIVQSSALLRSFLPWGIANTLLNIILNIVLVPTIGITGAAWSMLITELTGLFINIFFVHKRLSHD